MTAAIDATYSDYKRVKSRKVHQVVFEVPSEKWPEVYKVLGEPDIDTSQWFAIAKMEYSKPAETPKEKGKNYAANAAMLLEQGGFRTFLALPYPEFKMLDIDMADDELKQRLNIQSKAELITNNAAAERWIELRGEYEAWLRMG